MKPTEVTTCFPTLMDEAAINLYGGQTSQRAGQNQPATFSTSRDLRLLLEKER